MHIRHIEIGNFRKLKAVRVDFAPEQTVFVGANNSGKTSAMVALRRFLVDSSSFSINDLTLSNWKTLNSDAADWETAVSKNAPIPEIGWNDTLPFLDVWLHVEQNELHYVQRILPTLEWTGGLLGVRLRYEPRDREAFQKEYLKVRAQVATTLAGATAAAITTAVAIEPATQAQSSLPEVSKVEVSISLWPQSMIQFLERRMRGLFAVRAYLLDPLKLKAPVHGTASPQTLSADDEPIEGDPFKGLIAIDEINAQRGFGQVSSSRSLRDDEKTSERFDNKGGRRLSSQLRSYYADHLDPYETPEPKDLDALQALEAAARAFDDRLKAGFSGAFKELENLGYPGVTDPKLIISTKIRATDGLSHDAAVQYEVPTFATATSTVHRLPEESNGLGYQNLVSMVFALMSFRDGWMKVGKASKAIAADDSFIPPLHLVLVEEPEAHLHAQVQQVFINQAYAVLRNHADLGRSKRLTTQLIISTHSSHIAHACDFSSLRYFRRLPASAESSSVPIASVVNLSEVFGTQGQTERFVTRYLKATHCDLFFADGAIFVEGPAERILIPHFVEERSDYQYLRRCYLTWLEIGGSHAHRLRSLVEHLGITTLIIADLDAMAGATNAAVPPKRGQSQRTRNETLKNWIPKEQSLDSLIDMDDGRKVDERQSGYAVRVAYQTPVQATIKGNASEALANTFEDALLYQNMPFFTDRSGTGLVAKFASAIKNSADFEGLAAQVHEDLKGGGKAEFALDLLYDDDILSLVVPTYIGEGLAWLSDQLKRKERDVIGPVAGKS
jgi:predicted ATP-dependent endonuclease of OLD family